MRITHNTALQYLRTSLPFAGVTFWLLVFPLSGPVLGDVASPAALYAFLIPHIVTLCGIGFLWHENFFATYTRVGAMLALLGTCLYAAAPGQVAITQVLAGVGGAFAMVRAGALLCKHVQPVWPACFGLVGANFLLALVLTLDLPTNFLAVIAATILLMTLAPEPPSVSRGKLDRLLPVLPFVLVFHLTCGILYTFLLPLYSSTAWAPGVEVLFYAISVVVAARLHHSGRLRPLFLGLVMAVLAWVLLYPLTPVATNLGMWTIQGASGCVDLFLIVLFLSGQNPVQRFAFGCATICSGILLGSLGANLLDASPTTVLFFGSIALSLAALIFTSLTRCDPAKEISSELPEALRFLLSPRERDVMHTLVAHRTYRDVSKRLGIAESTVKTYMGRIYEKTGTVNKKELLRKYFGSSGT